MNKKRRVSVRRTERQTARPPARPAPVVAGVVAPEDQRPMSPSMRRVRTAFAFGRHPTPDQISEISEIKE